MARTSAAGRHRKPARPRRARWRAAVALLPRGTLAVGAGLTVFGGAAYLHLALAGRTLPARGMASLSVLWSLVYLLSLGVFLPIEQELTRLVAARRAVGDGITPVVRRAAVLAATICALIVAPLAAGLRPVADRLFGGDTAMAAMLASVTVALAVGVLSRGILAGLGRFGAYGSQLAIDGGCRIVLAGALAAGGVRSAAAFGLILTVTPVVAVAATLRPALAGLRPGTALRWRAMSGRLGLLLMTMLLAQLVVNIAVISVRLASPGDAAAVNALLAGVLLARLPLFAFTSVQTSLLPGLADAAAAGDRPRFGRLLTRGCVVTAVLGVLGGLPAAVLGPWLARTLFAAQPLLNRAEFAALVAGTLCYMLALVLGQATLALSRHRQLAACWLAGVAVLAAVTLTPGDLTLRVVSAYALGSLTVLLALAASLLLARLRTSPRADRTAAPA